jgi:hypothetical protein
MDNQSIINRAIDEVEKENPHAVESPRELIERVTNKFIQAKIAEFPAMCDVAFVMHRDKQKLLEETGRKGKFTDTYGWSEDGNTLAEYDIPQELYNFMQVFVYKDFWGNDNAHIWRPFMKKITKSRLIAYDATALFVKLKKYFGDTNLVKVS